MDLRAPRRAASGNHDHFTAVTWPRARRHRARPVHPRLAFVIGQYMLGHETVVVPRAARGDERPFARRLGAWRVRAAQVVARDAERGGVRARARASFRAQFAAPMSAAAAPFVVQGAFATPAPGRRPPRTIAGRRRRLGSTARAPLAVPPAALRRRCGRCTRGRRRIRAARADALLARMDVTKEFTQLGRATRRAIIRRAISIGPQVLRRKKLKAAGRPCTDSGGVHAADAQDAGRQAEGLRGFEMDTIFTMLPAIFSASNYGGVLNRPQLVQAALRGPRDAREG